MFAKAALKAAKAAIDAKKWDEAIEQAQVVLEKDANNYFAKVFIGHASDKSSRFEEAAKAYNDATAIKPEDRHGWDCGPCTSIWGRPKWTKTPTSA
jgi:predicted TPR repeat methyltransferase